MSDPRFPQIKKQLTDFLYDEEGSIPRSKIVTVGTLVLLLSLFFADSAFAAHRSHSSHSSHSSHRSHSSSRHGSHSSHSNHSNHSSATPVPVPNSLSAPESSNSNVVKDLSYNTNSVSGMSADPLTDGNIILTSNSDSSSTIAQNQLTAASIVDGARIKATNVGVTPKALGKTPEVPTKVVVPSASAIELTHESSSSSIEKG